MGGGISPRSGRAGADSRAVAAAAGAIEAAPPTFWGTVAGMGRGCGVAETVVGEETGKGVVGEWREDLVGVSVW